MTSDFSPAFGIMLTGLLARRGISQQKLARLLDGGYDHTIVSRWCSNQRAPRYRSVVAIADALDLAGDERARLFAYARFWPDAWHEVEDVLLACDQETRLLDAYDGIAADLQEGRDPTTIRWPERGPR
jgi:transcriptional regulator with XRE-family HTH domain